MANGARRGMRRWATAVLAAVATFGGLALPVPAGAEGAPAAAASTSDTPAPAEVTITDAGFSPANLTTRPGQPVHWVNTSTAARRVLATGGAFDSGTLQPGDGFYALLPVAGTYLYTSPAGGFSGSVVVRVAGGGTLPGASGDLVRDHLPDGVPTDEPGSFGMHPTLFVASSRTRLLVRFTATATVGQANSALAAAGVGVVGGVQDAGVVLVEVTDDGTFGPLQAALASLRANPVVAVAALDLAVGGAALPSYAEPAVAGSSLGWTWDVGSPNASQPLGKGANWWLEASRLPAAWNLLDPLRERTPDPKSRVAVYDQGFAASHPDLDLRLHVGGDAICIADGVCSTPQVDDHGTHVAGIIGARYDNRSGNRSIGISGVNPVGELSAVPWGGFSQAVSGLGGDPLGLHIGQVASFATSLAAFHAILDAAGTPAMPDLHAINWSGTGAVLWRDDQTKKFAWWDTYADRSPACGPGAADDATGTQLCTPDNHDGWLREFRATAGLLTSVAEAAAAKDVLIVQAAGNDGAFCDTDFGGPGGSCPLHSANVSEFGWVAATWASGHQGPPPILTVESVAGDDGSLVQLSSFSNLGGDVAAPGTNIYSTVAGVDPRYAGQRYGLMDGTSMAAPVVSGLASWLWSLDPTLTYAQVRNAILAYAQAPVSGSTAPRIDAFAASLAVPGAARMLVDVNDPSADGDRRFVLDAQGKVVGPDTTLHEFRADRRSQPDGQVGMRDFRRVRDAWLTMCANGLGTGASCPSGIASQLVITRGAEPSPKFDLNFDGCVASSLWEAAPATSCPTPETAGSRYDFNGDGVFDVDHDARVPLLANGSIAPSAAAGTMMDDLDVLASQWPQGVPAGPADPTEGVTATQLRGLLSSGDVTIRVDDFFAAGASSVAVTVDQGGATLPVRTATGREGVVVTVPSGQDVRIRATATVGGTQLSSPSTRVSALKPGEDTRVDLCAAHVELLPERSTLPADGEARTTVAATVRACGKPVPAGTPIAFTLTPSGAGHAHLDAVPTVVDATGTARVAVVAGTTLEDVTLKATVDLGDAQPAVGTTLLHVGAVQYVHYTWRQTAPAWSESGSTRWAGAPAGMPDCTTSGATRCIDTWTLGPADGEVPTLAREGVLTGSGSTMFLTETPSTDVSHSRSTTHLSDPDGAHAKWNLRAAGWRVKLSEATRYTDVAVPGVALSETPDGVQLTGFQALADLGYLHDAAESIVDGDTVEDPDVLPFTRGDLLLVPRADGIRYTNAFGSAIRFPRTASGGLAPYRYCGTATRDLTTQPGYLSADPSDWIPGATDVDRDPVFDPGDQPLPVGPGSLTLQWQFAAVVTTSPEPPADLALPDCSVPQPPTASFSTSPTTTGEGRVVFFKDLSTDPEGDIASWAWDFGDGTTSTLRDPDHRFPDDGTFTVTLRTTDAKGGVGTTSKPIVITNLAPEADVEEARAMAGQVATVPVGFADPGEADNASLHIKLTVDGAVVREETTKGTAFNQNVPGLAVGVHPVVLEVRDPDGATTTATARIVIAEVPPPPPLPVPGLPTCSAGVSLDAEEVAFLTELNAHRARNGLAPVTVSGTLTKAAEEHAADMLAHPEITHIGSDGSDWQQRAVANGYPAQSATGENVARGMTAGRLAYVAWHSSPPHNANMLNPAWKAIGIARLTTGTLPWSTTYGTVDDCALTPGLAPPPSLAAASPTAEEGAAELGGTTPAAPAPRPEDVDPSLRADAAAPAGAVELGDADADGDRGGDAEAPARTLAAPSGATSTTTAATAAPTGTTPVPAFRLSPDQPVPGGPTAFVNRTLRLNGATDLRPNLFQTLEGRTGNVNYPDAGCTGLAPDFGCGRPFPWGGAATWTVTGLDGSTTYRLAVTKVLAPMAATITTTLPTTGGADTDVRVGATATSTFDGVTIVDENAIDGATVRFTFNGTTVDTRSGVALVHTPAAPGTYDLRIELLGGLRWASAPKVVPFVVTAPQPGAGTVATVVGDGTGATPALATAMVPVAVALRGTTAYVADGQADQVKRIDAGGTATVIAGDGTTGSGGDGGPATAAQLDLPSGYTDGVARAGLAVDAAGNVFVADTGNHRVRRIATDGTISTVAGTGTAGAAGLGGPGTATQLSSPRGLALDGAGRLWIADFGNGRVLRLEADGTLSAVGGAMPFVSGIAVAPSGAIVVARLGDETVWSIDPATGAATRIGGDSTFGSQAAGKAALGTWFDGLVDVGVSPDGVVHVVTRHLLRKFPVGGTVVDEAGTITGTFGEPRGVFDGDGTATAHHLSIPVGVAYDAQGRAFVADRGNHRLRTVAGGTLTTIAGNGSCCVGGQRTTTLGAANAVALAQPGGIGVRPGGDLLVVDQANRTAYAVPTIGKVLNRTAGVDTPVCRCNEGFFTNVAPDMRFMGPLTDAAPGPNGRTYLAMAGTSGTGGQVYAVDPSGASNVPPLLTVVAGNGNPGSAGDGGPAIDAELSQPYAVTAAPDGSLYLADRGTNAIRRIAADGTISTLFPTANLLAPEDVAFGADGRAYIADTGNHRVKRVNADGTITTIAGTGTAGSTGDGGPATAARLDQPSDLVVDGGGTVYVADRASHRVRAILPDGRIVSVAGTGAGSGRAVEGARPSDTPFIAPDGLGLDGRTLLVSTGPRIVGFTTPAGPTLYVSDAAVAEGTGTGTSTATFTFSLLRAATTTTSVAWATQAGTATAGADFTGASGTVSFAPGEVTKTVAVAVARDAAVEPDEVFSLALTSPVGLELGDARATGTISDDDAAAPLPVATVQGTTVVEGTGTTPTPASATVVLSAPAPAPVSIGWTTQAGTATAGTDFTAASGTVVVAAGTSSASIPLSVVADSAQEASERFTVVLTSASGATLGTPTSADITITDDDAPAPPTLSISDVSVVEGASGTRAATFTVTASRASSAPITFRWATGGGTATAGTDYTAVASTQVSMAAGVVSRNLSVVVRGDTVVEPDETFEVTLSSPTGATLADAVGVGTITNDDAAAPTLSISDVSVVEGASGTKVATFAVTASRASTAPITFRWATGGGTATAGTDYTAVASTQVSMAAGVVSRNLSVVVRGDTVVEPDETFEVTLSSPTGATLADAVGVGTITNDDVAAGPSLRISDATTTEGASGTKTVALTVTLSQARSTDTTVHWATVAGTATAGSDFTGASGTATITAGTTSTKVNVVVRGDTTVEPNETFTVRLSQPSTGVTIADASGLVTITNDD